MAFATVADVEQRIGGGPLDESTAVAVSAYLDDLELLVQSEVESRGGDFGSIDVERLIGVEARRGVMYAFDMMRGTIGGVSSFTNSVGDVSESYSFRGAGSASQHLHPLTATELRLLRLKRAQITSWTMVEPSGGVCYE